MRQLLFAVQCKVPKANSGHMWTYDLSRLSWEGFKMQSLRQFDHQGHKLPRQLLSDGDPIKKKKQIDKYAKVCFVGQSGTGKTSLIKRLIEDPFFEFTTNTVGFDCSFYDREVDNLQVKYQLWDSAGQERFRAISPIHDKNADIVILVYDKSNQAQQNKVFEWIKQAVSNCPQDTQIMIIGNKIDLTEENKVYQPMDENAMKFIEKQHYTHMEVSCKTAFGLKDLWSAIDKQLIKKLNQQKKKISQTKNKTLSKKTNPKNKSSNTSSCC